MQGRATVGGTYSGGTWTGAKKFLEDLDLFRSEHDSVTMFLAPLPDFPPAQIFVVGSAEKWESLELFLS